MCFLKKPHYYLAYILAIIIDCFAYSSLAHDIYTIAVPIAANGQNATEARNSAIAAGEQKALNQLLQKLITSTSHKPLSASSSELVNSTIQSFEVSNEKITSNSYQAQLSVSFSPSIVRAFLNKSGISFSEKSVIRTLILPIYKNKDTILLWENTNSWHDHINTAIQASGSNRFLLPLGDLEDIAVLDKGGIDTVDGSKLTPFFTKYAVDTIIIASVNYDTTTNSLHVTESSYDGQNQPQITNKDFVAEDKETVAQLMDKAAADFIPVSKTAMHADKEQGAATELTATISFKDLKEWAFLRNKLEEIPQIHKLNVITLALNEAQITISYTGDLEKLTASLSNADLSLNKQGDHTVINKINQPSS